MFHPLHHAGDMAYVTQLKSYLKECSAFKTELLDLNCISELTFHEFMLNSKNVGVYIPSEFVINAENVIALIDVTSQQINQHIYLR